MTIRAPGRVTRWISSITLTVSGRCSITSVAWTSSNTLSLKGHGKWEKLQRRSTPAIAWRSAFTNPTLLRGPEPMFNFAGVIGHPPGGPRRAGGAGPRAARWGTVGRRAPGPAFRPPDGKG